MKQADIIVIGAGAAGLMAASRLTRAGKKVIVLEARERTGGRIHTIQHEHGLSFAELGAEFIHGELPVTLDLLREAGISYNDTRFEMFHHHNGQIQQGDEPITGWDELMEKMNQLEQDLPLEAFLDQHFSGPEYTAMRKEITAFVNGYDTASLSEVSTFAIRSEWEHEDDEAQHRVSAGYRAMIQYLQDICTKGGSEILLQQVVQRIEWTNGSVTVYTQSNSVYQAVKVVVALPLGVLQQANGVTFEPALQQHTAALHDIGFGAIIKILLEFTTPFWMNDAAFGNPALSASTTRLVVSGETVPTYWTQTEPGSTLLTGWLGGPPAWEMREWSADEILHATLTSLHRIYQVPLKTLQSQLSGWQVVNWTADPYTRGSYAYDKVPSSAARKILSQPIQDTVYFAGEYLYEGPAMGTVEAALTSGKSVASIITT
ncbi:flavin monoamine oxidase family protein [Chitinophaga jiangningensis]|nr:NAD(P)/FAD-dependent oxidoreductase [Chitinophaga jiangningensis]